MKKIYSDKAPEPVGPYSQAIEMNGMYFFSGQIGLKNGKLQDVNIKTETQQVLLNLEAVLKTAGLKKENIVKISIFMTNLKNFSLVNEIYEKWLKNHKPARETIGVASLPINAHIEISLIAVKGN